MTPHMNKKSKNETAAIRTQLTKSSYLEHSNPLYLTSSFVFEDAEDMRASFAEEKNRNVYSRFSNPNNAELVDKLCQLEGAEAGHTFATGMGAIFSSFAALLNSGDHVLSARAVFGSTHTLFTKIFPKWNIETTYFDATDLDAWTVWFCRRPKFYMLNLRQIQVFKLLTWNFLASLLNLMT